MAFRLVSKVVDDQAFFDDLPDRHARAERAVGVLENNLHALPQRSQCRPVEPLNRRALKRDLAHGFFQADQCATQAGFARS